MLCGEVLIAVGRRVESLSVLAAIVVAVGFTSLVMPSSIDVEPEVTEDASAVLYSVLAVEVVAEVSVMVVSAMVSGCEVEAVVVAS